LHIVCCTHSPCHLQLLFSQSLSSSPRWGTGPRMSGQPVQQGLGLTIDHVTSTPRGLALLDTCTQKSARFLSINRRIQDNNRRYPCLRSSASNQNGLALVPAEIEPTRNAETIHERYDMRNALSRINMNNSKFWYLGDAASHATDSLTQVEPRTS